VWTPLDYLDASIEQLRLPDYRSHKMTDIYKTALVKAQLFAHYKAFGDPAYLDYISLSKSKTLKGKLKATLIDWFAKKYADTKRLEQLQEKYIKSIKKSDYYLQCRAQLEGEQPSFVFCTNQRMITAAAPMLAAQELGIPTGTFIFSWDNMPKGNLSVPADHYFVWSEYMKKEFHKYYPDIDRDRVHVVGTPQFIPYTNERLYESREDFCAHYNLNPSAKIICFSGDDVTTSPHDPLYLRDTAEAVRRMNELGGGKYQILFRRCPVDVSERYNGILEKYDDVIFSAPPLWKKPKGSEAWHGIVPTPEDIKLLVNTVLHCDTAVNVGSTIAHDFACMGKTSCYFKYNPVDKGAWDIHKIYRYIHFRSMQGLDPIYWIESSEDIDKMIIAATKDSEKKILDAKQWLRTIVTHPLSDANGRIWKTINNITKVKPCT